MRITSNTKRRFDVEHDLLLKRLTVYALKAAATEMRSSSNLMPPASTEGGNGTATSPGSLAPPSPHLLSAMLVTAVGHPCSQRLCQSTTSPEETTP
nr:hypothetical protein Iba_chr07fCG5840 [Ipomoea batatas]